MIIPPVHPAAGDSPQIDVARQFADINKGLIVQGPRSGARKTKMKYGEELGGNSRL